VVLAPSRDKAQWLGQKIWAATLYATSKGIISYSLVVLEAFHLLDDCAAIALSENAFRERELAFRCDPFVLFGDALDAVARIIGISVRSGNEMADFIGTRG
jgi:hypothetical protein